MSTTSHESSPRGHSPSGFIQPRHTTKGSYVKRWKALQERNRNLPKIDFTVKSQLIPKRQNKNPGMGVRSLTLDSMKLPSICTASSVITSTTNASGYSSKTARTEKKSINIQVLIHYTRWKYADSRHHDSDTIDKEKDLSSSISRSLPNIATAVQNETKNSSTNAKHRFEKFTNSKKLQTRKNEPKELPQKEEVVHTNNYQPLEKSDS